MNWGCLIPEDPAPANAPAEDDLRRAILHHGRFLAPADAVQVHRLHAPMGLPEVPRRAGRRYPNFQLRMDTEAVDLVREGDRTVGLRARTPRGNYRSGPIWSSRPTAAAPPCGTRPAWRSRTGVPIDVLWLRLPRPADIPVPSLGYAANGRFMVLIDRGDYFQCGVIIPEGTFEAIQQNGIPAFRRRNRGAGAFHAQPSRHAGRLERGEAPDGEDRSAAPLVSAGAAVYR